MSAQPERHSIDIDAARAVSIADVIRRYVPDLKRKGGEHTALCPFHNEKSPSFTVNDDKGFYHCFGCGAHGDVIDFVQLIGGVDFREAVDSLTGGASDPEAVRRHIEARAEVSRLQASEDTSKAKQAGDIWKVSQAANGGPVDQYLHGRGVTIPVPPSIRFHPALMYKPSNLELPAMVAALQRPDGQVVGVHRTYILPNGRGKAPVSSPKMALGRLAGNAVRLAAATETLGIAEGIETGLSAMQLYDDPVWCACGSNLAGVIVPDTVKRVVIYADNGEAGQLAADKAAAKFYQQGRRVTIVRPIDGFGDFNDYLQAQAKSEAA